MSLSVFLGALSIVVGVIGYAPYLWSMFKGNNKPHVFSWVVWSLISFIAFFIQIKNGAGPGSWVVLFSSCLCIVVALYSLKYSRLTIVGIDWLYFTGALLALLCWLVLDQPFLATICIILTDAFGFAPTFRKAWSAPHDESITVYVSSAIKFIIAIFALTQVSFLTIAYPLYLVIANTAFTIFTLWRRRVLEK